MSQIAFSSLRIERFRCLEAVRIEPHARLNLFTGANASGKTSLLEAIFTLARGRSFRANRLADCLRYGEANWRIGSSLRRHGQPEDRMALAWSPQGASFTVNEEVVALTEVARRLPVQIVEPNLHKLIEEGPAYRRRYLDWGLFHVEHDYLTTWRRYTSALRQRNASLRAQRPEHEIRVWDHQLAEVGERLHASRMAFVAGWQTLFVEQCKALLGSDDVQIRLLSGWRASQESLAEALETKLQSDRSLGSTSVGPHRAELRIVLDGQIARGAVSRGQQKMLVAAMVMSQALYVRQQVELAPVLLLDDFTAELGDAFQTALAAALKVYPGQCFVTAVDPHGPLTELRSDGLFHVEHGVISPA